MKIGKALLTFLALFLFCFGLGIAYGTCKAGAVVTYRLLTMEPR